MEDLLLPAYQKLFAALQSFERFSKGQDLFENITCLDSFLSEFRNVTFVLQKSLAHTDYIREYQALREQYLKNDDCSWLVEKRNEVSKERPFNLEKILRLTLYHPNGAGVISMDTYTIANEENYSSLVEMIKDVIERIPAIEVFFSIEFDYREVGSERNLFMTIDNGIDAMMALLDNLNKTMKSKPSAAREKVLERISGLHFHEAPKDFWFVDDYVFYRKDSVFEKGDRFELITPFKAAIPYTTFCEMLHVENRGDFINETFEAFERMHCISFYQQRELAPTFLSLKNDGTLSMVMYHASIKTTTYRKIHEIAAEIKSGVPIVAVFYVCEMLFYDDPEIFNQDYSYRSVNKHEELLSFEKVTKDGAVHYCINSDAILDGKKDCRFPTLMIVETDDSISFMKPLVEALHCRE